MGRGGTLLCMLLVGVGVGIAGCGSDEKTDADPLSVVPSGAVISVKLFRDAPTTATKQASRILSGSLGEGAGPELSDAFLGLLQLRAHGVDAPDLDYGKDIKPWLGRGVVFFATPRGPSGLQELAIAASAKDPSAARKTLARLFPDVDDEASYRGVSYQRYRGGRFGFAVLDGVVVVGDEIALKRAIVAAKGRALDRTARYRQSVRRLANGRVGEVYIDFERLYPALNGQIPSILGDTITFGQRLNKLRRPAGAAQLLGVRNGLGVDVRLQRRTQRLFGFSGPGSQAPTDLLSDLPAGDAAFGVRGFGRLILQFLNDPKSMDLTASEVQTARAGFRQATGASLDVILKSLGDVGASATGRSVDDLSVGLVSQGAPGPVLRALGAALPLVRPDAGLRVSRRGGQITLAGAGLPAPLSLKRAGRRLAFGYRVPARTVIKPPMPLRSSPAYRKAIRALGSDFKPTIFLDVPPVARFLSSLGRVGRFDLSKIGTVLQGLGPVMQGERREGRDQIARTVITAR